MASKKNIISQSSEVMKNIINSTGIQALGGVPTQISEVVVPIINVSPTTKSPTEIYYTNVRTASNGTLLTTATDKDFYITNILISVNKDAVCDITAGANTYLETTILSKTVRLMSFTFNTLTAEQYNFTVNMTNPIKIDRGVVVRNVIDVGYSAGNLVRNMTIYGFYL